MVVVTSRGDNRCRRDGGEDDMDDVAECVAAAGEATEEPRRYGGAPVAAAAAVLHVRVAALLGRVGVARRDMTEELN